MSLGLPSHLSRAANSRALAAAACWAALVCLGAAVINIAVSGVGKGDPLAWLMVLVLAPMIALLILLARRRTLVLTIAYLAVGTLGTYFYVLTLLTENVSYRDTNLFVVALPIVAMTLVGGTGTGALVGVLWGTLGFALAEAAVFLAAHNAGREFRTDAISLGAYLLLIGILTFDGLTRTGRSRPQSAIHRAVRDSRLVEMRRDLIADSTADLHDTVLSELVAIANAEPGPLSPKLRDRLEADLRTLGRDPSDSAHGEEPSIPGPSNPPPTPSRPRPGFSPGETVGATPGGTDAGGAVLPLILHLAVPAEFSLPLAPLSNVTTDAWFDSELHNAIELARDEGLSVDISGDRDALAQLSLDRRRAIGLATRQCLVNVLRHSGSATAEVAVSASSDAVSVMVVDSGRGFVQSSTASDRLGLRQSVQDRIERVGGTVTVYSIPDVGTTVLMIVPTGEDEASS
ncbi:sensor histidine kinase [Leifsonia poae]|uniref:sensor histidine kinase n=1 Tax=Leifsonia poae TaxID=110933 RepID=UPI003D66B43E